MAEDAEDCVTVKEEEFDEDEDGRRSEANFSPVFIVPSSKEDELPRYRTVNGRPRLFLFKGIGLLPYRER